MGALDALDCAPLSLFGVAMSVLTGCQDSDGLTFWGDARKSFFTHPCGRSIITHHSGTKRSTSLSGGVVVVAGNVVGQGGHRMTWAVLVAASTLVVAGCSSVPSSISGGTPRVAGSSGAPTPGTAPSVVSPADTARQQATAAYLGMWQDMATAATTSDWQSPRIGQHATGDALLVISKSLYTDHLNGVVTKGAPTDSPTVSSVDPPSAPTTVVIDDCGDSSNWLKYRNGQLFDTPGGRRSITAEVKKQPDGSWKVTRFAVEALGSC